MTHTFLDVVTPIGIAHRGGTDDYPENTMRAFRSAYELGYRYLETDVHLSADGVVVAFHDDILDRVTNRSGRLADLTWDEISEAEVAAHESVSGVDRVPRMIELFEAFPHARFNIDAKSDDVLLPLLELIREAGVIDRVCVASFDHARLQIARSTLGPELCTSASRRDVVMSFLRAFRLPVPPGDAAVLQPPVRVGRFRLVSRRYIEQAHRDGRPVHVWTVDDPDDMTWLIDIGVDGVMTDRPALLKQVFTERGVWETPTP
jgi:glycerophosphoryl diester phosphodiesterase